MTSLWPNELRGKPKQQTMIDTDIKHVADTNCRRKLSQVTVIVVRTFHPKVIKVRDSKAALMNLVNQVSQEMISQCRGIHNMFHHLD